MSESNFAIAEEKKEEDTYIPLTYHRFIRQKAGLRVIRQRKRREKKAMNKIVHAPRKAKKAMRKQGMTGNIQRGFNTAKRWKESD